MKRPKSLRVSVIVPCYNEEESIRACLEALSSQRSKPFEVIMVDNNCSDRTVHIAQRFGFVKIVQEKKPGLVAARDRGFSIATGDILARIDADSVVAENWIEKIQESFTSHTSLQAITGSGYFYDAPLRLLHRPVRDAIAVWFNRLLCSHFTLWGSNMAMRTSTWRSISGKVCRQSNLMEDVDLSIHIFNQFGRGSVRFIPTMLADTSMRRSASSFAQLYRYFRMWPRTLRVHGYWGAIFTWPAIWFLLINNIWAHLLIRIYDGQQKRYVFSLSQIRQKVNFDRDNP